MHVQPPVTGVLASCSWGKSGWCSQVPPPSPAASAETQPAAQPARPPPAHIIVRQHPVLGFFTLSSCRQLCQLRHVCSREWAGGPARAEGGGIGGGSGGGGRRAGHSSAAQLAGLDCCRGLATGVDRGQEAGRGGRGQVGRRTAPGPAHLLSSQSCVRFQPIASLDRPCKRPRPQLALVQAHFLV